MNRFKSFLFASVFTFCLTGFAYTAEEAAQKDAKPSDYYVGVVCAPVPDILEMHLNLKKGVLVQGLAPDGPAEKAKFKPGDIILSVNGKDVKETHDIISAIDGDKELTFSVFQNGEKKEIKVKPEKRPESFTHLKTPATGVFRTLQPGIIFDGKDSSEARDLIKKFIEQMESVGVNAEEVHPNGLDKGANVNRFEVSITPGKGPGTQKIHVRQNNEVWEVEKIEDLPAEMQEKVKKMLVPFNQGQGIILPHNWEELSDSAKKEYHSLSEKAKEEYRILSGQAGKHYDTLSEKAKEEYKKLAEQASKQYGSLSEKAKEEYDFLSGKSAEAWKAMQEKLHQEHEALEKEMQKAYQHAPELKDKFNQYRKSTQDYIESFWKSAPKEEEKK